jgi:peptide-methionine (S)-S-oxide reductase
LRLSEQVGFGGGCHWCTEAVYQALQGVGYVEQGFIQSLPPDDGWSEAVIVTYDPVAIGLATLIEIHLRTHASTSAHKMRGKYRSAIYPTNEVQSGEAQVALDHLQSQFAEPIVTQVLHLAAFKPSDTRFHDYYRSDPTRPFCQTYIDPKLNLLRERFAEEMRAESEEVN